VRLKDRVVVITGAAGAIGGGIARALGAEGARLVLIDIAAERLERTAQALRDAGAAAEALPLDITDRVAVCAAMGEVAERHGQLDQLWNNAGVVQVGPLLEIDAEEWRRVFAVNVEGALYCTQAALRHMLDRPPDPDFGYRGKIVNVSSGAADRGRPMLAAYGASKAALNHLTKSVAAAFGERGICAASLYPGSVYEGMWQQIDRVWSALEGLPPGEMGRRRAANTPTGRFQTPDELGRIARYIALAPGLALNGKIVYSEPAVVDA
jgi:NAD(P)-dependent dehydrogenase (short-subunit alcohol dehydrogenase family)